MKENTSPEERLLHLIKGQGKKEKPIVAPAISSQNLKVLKEKSLFQTKAHGFEVKGSPQKNFTRKTIFLKRVNAGLLVIMGLLAAASVVMLKALGKTQGSDAYSKDDPKSDGSAVKIGQSERKPYANYADIISQHALFKAAAEEQKQPVVVDTLPQVSPLELLSNYYLAGVVSGQSPQAIIEDKKAQKTYFLGKGQSLGEFKIHDIMEGKVILDFKGQKLELSL